MTPSNSGKGFRSTGGSIHSSEAPLPDDTRDGGRSGRVVPERPPEQRDPTGYDECIQRTIHQVKTSGWVGARQNILLYLRMMVPVTIVCAWMFTIYAALSWTIPHLLCKHTIDTYSVSDFRRFIL